jgi:hypothetical protein
LSDSDTTSTKIINELEALDKEKEEIQGQWNENEPLIIFDVKKAINKLKSSRPLVPGNIIAELL